MTTITLLPVAGAVALLAAVHIGGGLFSKAGWEFGALADPPIQALITCTSLLASWLIGRRASQAAPHTTLEDARTLLARQVLHQWRAEIRHRRLDDRCAPVRWRLSRGQMDQAQHVVRGRGPVQFRSDQIGSLVTLMSRRLKRPRLVLLGEPGMGKTAVSALLVREILHHPDFAPTEPVPFLLPLQGWLSGTNQQLDTWLAQRLREEYPGLGRAVEGHGDAAQALVDTGSVAPVLDGFDELLPAHQRELIAELNHFSDMPFVLTSRIETYSAALDRTGTPITCAAVLRAADLRARDAATYLGGCLTPTAHDTPTWTRFLDHIRARVHSPVSTALRTPLHLWLMREVYAEPGADPTELTDPRRFPTAEDVVDHLYTWLIPVLLRADERRLPTSRQQYGPHDVTRWLGYLAHSMTTREITTIEWWNLNPAATMGTKSFRFRATLFSYPITCFSVVVIASIVPGRPWIGDSTQILALCSLILFIDIAFPVSSGGRRPVVRGYEFSIRRARTSITRRHWVLLAFSAILVYTVGTAAQNPRNPAGMGTEPAIFFLFSVIIIALLFAYFLEQFRSHLPLDSTQTFRATLQADRSIRYRSALTTGLVLACCTAVSLLLVILLAFRHEPMFAKAAMTWSHSEVREFWWHTITGYAWGVGATFTFFFLASLMWTSRKSASSAFFIVKCVLVTRGCLPCNTVRFLESMHRIGLLRQVGAAYQFRHMELQKHLSERYRSAGS